MPAAYTSLVTKMNKIKSKRMGINSAGKTAQTTKCSPTGNKYKQLKKGGWGKLRLATTKSNKLEIP